MNKMNKMYEFSPEDIESLTTLELIKEFDLLRRIKEKLEEKLKEINKKYDFIRITVIPNRFESEGIESMKVEGVGRINLTGDMYVSILPDKKTEAYDFFRDIGKGSLITETINSSTLKAAVKQMILSGEEVPDSIVKVTPFTRASITKK